ncbi:MAG: hypothetical protein A3I88_02540 [Candidatus Portnoybacteria bacterium RIFCSPLOWO2_12_FULL_39_9]|uniref:Methyltransferase type 11 domain-containing protein n=1 Tax=Candidatus Portnoybacteria bacterium RIFCSPHIGHO2_12_FULL_38_9 TaxID=1801997 RepID=A0A1G2FH11_9BACT|nr:MAG: hypothetical protein A3H00_01270 [Candidatus Portnoybacteria bacterium RBG_13_40_8]OGZ35742.1 MAG: hypothetical protein A2646_02895 [Candidatus Portnoybacteria bacterium RIFCSPHIGHO2_02_FULL_39_12]OGZ37117.1 MAG: hypothetical protein A3J64_01220 [Candidatus Portnoybacteria bacterium RIFCSPHIGHO2_12_FULL_38_9]OGZ39486.1 MAG: hypothetical protein A3F21_03235 [Candidatus Portnoybacteria bacterium RIFCSPLOWO2_01_FULL_38_39]OGZ39714.1 MAG: hypothetical protein A3I88_02540 [Candidatus Portnoy
MYIYQPDRVLLKRQIEKYSHYIKGKVLDVGAGKTSRYRDLFDCREYIKMDIEKSDNIDIVGQAENIPFENNTFDSIICTQVLGDVEDIFEAIKECYRVLKPNGMILLTESMVEEIHNKQRDSWRFTRLGMKRLFKKAGFKIIILSRRGGFFSIKAQINTRYLIDKFNLYSHKYGRVLSPFFRAYSEFMFFLDKIDQSQANKKFALGWCIIAKK